MGPVDENEANLSSDVLPGVKLEDSGTNKPTVVKIETFDNFDYTINIWQARIDKVRGVQRQWGESHTLPPASELGIPASPVPVTVN